MLLTAV